MELLSYKNDPILKKKFVAEIEKHRKADQIEQGHYGKENGKWKGCAVACSLHSLAILDGEKLVTKYDNHTLYESKLGIPKWMALLEDKIFEGLPVAYAKNWPTRFAKAVPIGINLEPIKWKFCAFILRENIERVQKLDIKDDLKELVVKAIQGVLSLNENAITTGLWNESAAESAESTESTESAESAAWSAYKKYANELIRLLEEMK